MFGLFKRKKDDKKHVEKIAVKRPLNEEEDVILEPEMDETQTTDGVKKERKMSYHVTRHPSGGWQLKKGKAERALKRFDTQKEAIDYAKQLEKDRGISFLIHKLDGSTRKKKY